jgi:starch-binding outer membrane protein, SusD/RagB family
MMMISLNSRFWVVALAGACFASTACDDFLNVKNPASLEAEAIDEQRDGSLLNMSAYQSFVAQYGNVAVYSAWFTNEARVGDTFPTRNDFGKRDVPPNGDIQGIWNTLQTAIQYAERTIASTEPDGNTIDLARTYLASGFGILLQAELWCEGTLAARRTLDDPVLEARGPMTSAALMDSAIVRLQTANDIAKALTGTDASNIANAALVGIARAHLFVGRKAQASSVAAAVPAAFEYNLLHLDDPSNRGRLGNTIWSFSESRISLVTGPEYRAMADAGDTRIKFTDMGRVAQDGQLRFYRQGKIAGWGSSDRLASGLEAQYIKIEADANPAAMLDFINARRAVGNQAPIAATTDGAILLRELMEQKSRDFWLENKRIGDLRRNGSAVPYIIDPGPTYYKPELGLVQSQTCWPVAQSEMDNNPNWPKS